MKFIQLLSIACLVFVLGCSTIDPYTKKKLDDYVSKHPEISESKKKMILSNKYDIGMNKEEIELLMGKSYSKDIFSHNGVEKERWHYRGDQVYFEDGIVVATKVTGVDLTGLINLWCKSGGCTQHLSESQEEWAWNSQFRQAVYIQNNKELSNEIKELISKGKIQIGMSKEDVTASWGKPESVNKSVYASGVHEQWVYHSNQYLYFDDGTLKSFQTSENK